MQTKVDVSIIIVNWNAGELLNQCIKSIIEYTEEITYEIIVVDNNSKSLRGLEELFDNELIKFILLDENIGFSKANNLGVQKAKGKYILFLNPDTIIIDNSIKKLKDSFEMLSKSFKVGILVPKLLNQDKSNQRSTFSFPIISLKRVFNYFKKRVIKNEYKLYQNKKEVEWARGACMFTSRSIGNSYGFWNENFFLYGEDLEICYRYNKFGYLTFIDPNIKIIHYYNQSGKKKFEKQESLRTKEKGLKLFYKTHLNRFSFFLIEVAFLFKGFIEYIKFKDNNRIKLSIHFIKKIFSEEW
ncbi:hypothetical protein C8C78_12610 [Halanaerobium congolense]|jgi:hypothetical protein|uniref:Glycosyltransferase 2-like domain-containing protein n=1 Tax=Halanaerobium congolense TaxID=54121 RepID=A0A318E3W3_9FIRM|nr:glycosyltransferase family 2 protein [Halanaerobium congolense]PXV63073.1 hypothetical protein C8C78_12610 [Halanaerobium congolense]